MFSLLLPDQSASLTHFTSFFPKSSPSLPSPSSIRRRWRLLPPPPLSYKLRIPNFEKNIPKSKSPIWTSLKFGRFLQISHRRPSLDHSSVVGSKFRPPTPTPANSLTIATNVCSKSMNRSLRWLGCIDSEVDLVDRRFSSPTQDLTRFAR